DDVLVGDADALGDAPVLGPLVDRPGGPPEAHDHQLPQPGVEGAVPQQCGEHVLQRPGHRRVAQQDLEHAQVGHEGGDPRLLCRCFGVLHGQAGDPGLAAAHGTSTPCTGGTSPSPAIARSRSSTVSRDATRRGRSAKGHRREARMSRAWRYAGAATPSAPMIRSSLSTMRSGTNPGVSVDPRVPASTTVPPGRATAMAWASADGAFAVTSTTMSASPPVASLSAVAGSVVA